MKLFRLLAAGLVPFLNLGGFVPLLAESTVTDPAVLAAANSLVVAGGKFWSKAYTTGKVFNGSGWVYADGTSGGTVDPTYTSQPSPTPSGNNGWDGSTYYLNGTASTLDSTGSGFNTSDETYYINGLATTLDKDGNGWGPSHNLYVNGVDTGGATGWDPTSNSYYIDGAWTPLDQTGKGWNNDEGVYYVGGLATTLDQNGNGIIDNVVYAKGAADPYYQPGLNGWSGAGYYLDGNATTLDQFGNGFNSADNIYYLSGLQTALDNNGSGSTVDSNGYTGYYQNGQKLSYTDGGGTMYDANGNGIGTAYPFDLDQYGNGWGSWYLGNVEYKNGIPSHYNGVINGTPYLQGEAVTDPNYTSGMTGWSGMHYYIAGVPTFLDPAGTGWATPDAPDGGDGFWMQPWPVGYYYQGVWDPYKSGRLDGYGSDGLFYDGGRPVTGLRAPGEYDLVFINGKVLEGLSTTDAWWGPRGYYLGGRLTSLDDTGTGVWEGVTYVNGVAQ